MTGQALKPCPYRKEHEWEPESFSTPREICRNCYAAKPELPLEVETKLKTLEDMIRAQASFYGPHNWPVP